MPLVPGARLGPYEILAPLGAGGMGEVYRARDSRLNREVALKILPELFTLDPDRLARFRREAQVLASLNHPNIAAIYGFEEANPSTGSGQAAVRALVLELVEGPTLAEVIARRNATESGQSPRTTAPSEGEARQRAGVGSPRGLEIDEALPIARQIAEALEAAHERGIIHRDLKPSNIKVRSDGTVKVLDFGLAKALAPDAVRAPTGDVSQSPTITTPAATRMGVIMGTAAYMSPEQARGKPVDKRADIWAFGCVLYEMLTGKRAFAGEDVSETLATVLKGEPDWSALPPSTPSTIRRLLRRCLEKDPKERIPDISVARFEIKEALTTPPTDADAVRPTVQRSRWTRAAVLIAVLLVGGIMGGSLVRVAMRPAPASAPGVVRFAATPPASEPLLVSGLYRDIAISRDGMRMAYPVGGGQSQLVIRSLDQLAAPPLQGLGQVRSPFFSPDGRWVGFYDPSSVSLKKVSVTGGPPITLCMCRLGGGTFRGATWSSDDSIIFASQDPTTGLLRVPGSGGEPEVLTRPSAQQGEQDHLWPEIVPGGEAVLFTIVPRGSVENSQIAVLNFKTGEQKILLRGGSHAQYVPSGHLVYGVAGRVHAVAFDLARLEVVGDPVQVLEHVFATPSGGHNVSVSEEGTLLYVGGGAMTGVTRILLWVDRQGREESIKAPPRAYTLPRLSPDGTQLALDVRDQEGDIWIWDFGHETMRRLTFESSEDQYPVWTHDGQRVVFESSRSGAQNLFWQAADGTGAPERLTENANTQFPNSFSPDATRLVFREDDPKTGPDLKMLVLTGQRRVDPLVHTDAAEMNAEVSPDGRWVVYQSNESGRHEIYVRSFPDVEKGRWQISSGGGTQPAWAPNGKELFYIGPDGRLMAADVQAGQTFAFAAPKAILERRYYSAITGRPYDVSPDGQRFLMIKEGGTGAETSAAPQLIVVLN